MNLLMFLGGLILLVIGANTLVRGASKLALSNPPPSCSKGALIQ